METKVITEQERIAIVASRIVAYYLQIIEIKKSEKRESTFVIDQIPNNRISSVSLVHLEDKYDGKSNWRDSLGILDHDGWNTLGGSFRDMGMDSNNEWYINIEQVLIETSKLLSKAGIANYFESPKSSDLVDDADREYQEYTWKQLLVIVL